MKPARSHAQKLARNRTILVVTVVVFVALVVYLGLEMGQRQPPAQEGRRDPGALSMPRTA